MAKQPDVVAVVQRHRAALLRGERRATQQMRGTWRRVQTTLRRRIADIEVSLADYQRRGLEDEWLRREQARLQTLQQSVEAQIRAFTAEAERITTARVNAAVNAAPADAAAAIAAAAPPGIGADIVRLPAQAVRDAQAITRSAQFRALFARLGQETGRQMATQAARIVTEALAEGRHPRETARRLRELVSLTPDSRPLPLWQAETIARTETMRAYRLATIDTYRENRDVVREWVWICALDRTSCASCIAQHGTTHPLDEEMATHPRCRCVAAPKTAPWADLGAPNLDEPEIETGDEWFRRQKPAVKREILGQSKHRAWRSRSITLADLVERRTGVWGPSTSEASLTAARANAQARRAAARRAA